MDLQMLQIVGGVVGAAFLVASVCCFAWSRVPMDVRGDDGRTMAVTTSREWDGPDRRVGSFAAWGVALLMVSLVLPFVFSTLHELAGA